MSGPFGGLSAPGRRRTIGVLLTAELAQLAPLLAVERRMRRTGGPGIIPFELAGSSERASEIIATWGEDGCAAARRSLRLDYLFPTTYAPLQALACSASADRLASIGRRRLARVGGALGWARLAAALCDYAENTALLLILGGRNGRLPGLARRAALTKFALNLLGLGYVLLGGLARIRLHDL